MLTGDKRETAHDIAKTTFLIDHDTTKYQFFPDAEGGNLEGWRVDFHRKIKAALSDVETNQAADRQQRQRQRQHSVFIGSECALPCSTCLALKLTLVQVHVDTIGPRCCSWNERARGDFVSRRKEEDV